MQARNKKTGAKIVAIVDQVLGNTGVTNAGFELDEHGRVVIEYDDSGTSLCWDACEAYEENGGCVFLDADKENVRECDIELFEDESDTVKHPVVDLAETDLKTIALVRDMAERRNLKVPPRTDIKALLDNLEQIVTASRP